MRFTHKHTGYTLLELALALALIASLTAIAMPSFRHLIAYHDELLLRSQLKEAIHIARLSAETEQLPIGICPSNNQHTCGKRWLDGLLIFKDTQQGRIQNDTQMIAFISLPVTHGVLFWRAYPRYRYYLRFMPIGGRVDNGVFWYCRQHAIYPAFAMMLNHLGEARWVVPVAPTALKDSRGYLLSCDENYH